MKFKKIIAIIVSVIVVLAVATGLYVFFILEDKNSTLTMAEKQWIEDNKNDIIDLGFINNVPIFNYDGEGLFFDFVTALETDTGLEFNKLSYSFGSTSSSAYSLKITNELSDSDILIYEDNYAVITKVQAKYNRLLEIPVLTLGVLESDYENAAYYLKENTNITLKSYTSEEAITSDINAGKLDGAVFPKTIYLNQILNNDLYINYNITEMTKSIVLSLGSNEKLNIIIEKYFEKWESEQYNNSFNSYFTKYYLDSSNISEDAQVNFTSKQYKYGFVSLAPYDKIVNSKLYGINKEILKGFGELAGIEIKYMSEYASSEKLIKSFNENKIDLFFNTSSNTEYEMDVVNTVSVSDEDIVVIAEEDTNFVVNSVYSLKNYKIATIKGSKISSELNEYGITVKEYSNIKTLLNNLDSNYLIVIDNYTYETYFINKLHEYKEIYSYNLKGKYNYTVRNIEDNEVFINYFNFYLSYINEKEYANKVNFQTFTTTESSTVIIYITLALSLFIILFVIYSTKVKKDKKPNKVVASVSKESKLKYIDMLTSLKNRNYLNDSIEKWDDTEIYPQAIIVADLNNIAYVNDNYGHTEGDNVIKEAANVLIKSQIENSEIMRTNGNEFLIYLVEYDEKQVSAYVKKLFKEFKELSHGFGAALGYSMITDGLKTIDDAINEATLDMRTNKEEANN